MAQITIAGKAVVITSSVKLEDYERVAKYRPKALILTDEESKEPVFRVCVGDCGGVSKYGIEFNSETNDGEKLACLTLVRVRECGDVKKDVAEEYGSAIMNLNKIEAGIADALAEINADEAAVMSNITIVQ